MKFTFIVRILNLEIKAPINKFRLTKDIFLSNKSSVVDNLLERGIAQSLIGWMEYENLKEGVFAYSTGNTQDVNQWFNKCETQEEKILFLDYYMRSVQTFINSAWLLKDNSLNTELGYLCLEKDEGIEITSNSRVNFFTKADGSRDTTSFNRDEIKEIIEIAHNVYDIEGSRKLSYEESHLFLSTKAVRAERFLYFLQSARAEAHFPSRIALYCTVLESIFSTSRTEMTHKISERAAILIGLNNEERIGIYNTIKDAYSIRSSTVHGDLVSNRLKDLQKQKNICLELDRLLRRLSWEIINNKSYSMELEKRGDELEEYYNEMILIR